MDIQTKRIYEAPANRDGRRVLVDRLWPRGVSKEDARLTAWMKELAPSDALRQWFGHDPEKWDEFQRRYRKELQKHKEALAELQSMAEEKRLTLVYSAKDEKHNNAEALKRVLARHKEDVTPS